MDNEFFKIDNADLRRFSHYLQDSPKLFRPVIRETLNSLAFLAREWQINTIKKDMIVRNEEFIKSVLRVKEAKTGDIASMVAYAGSIKKDRFTGWIEQQEGKHRSKNRASTLAGRGGNIRNQMIGTARLKSANNFYKPEQFQGRDLKSSFMFMLRVLATRRGGRFLLSQKIDTKRGALGRGLYSFTKIKQSYVNKRYSKSGKEKMRFVGKIIRLQDFDKVKQPKHTDWLGEALAQVKQANIDFMYNQNLDRLLKRFK